MNGSEAAGEHAIHFFRERLRKIAGAQSRLNVTDRNAGVKRGQSSIESSRGIALHEDDVGTRICANRFERSQNARCRPGERLAGGHRIQIVIGSDAKNGQRLVEHLAVLRRDRDADAELLRPRPHAAYDGSKLDGFGACAEYKERLHHVFSAREAAESAMPESDPALGQIVGGEFESDFVAGQNANAITAKPASQMGEDKAFVLKLDAEFTAGEFLDDRTLYFYAVFFTHSN
jgi:hypothetical protein